MKPITFSTHIKDLVARKPRKKKQDRQPALFKPDFSLLQREICPVHLNKLYWNLKRTLLICRKFKHVFTLDVISGKRLEEWKQQDALNRR